MGRRGRKRQLVVEDEYWKLILAGVGTVEACRRVGVTRETGYRWRAERGGLAPLRLAEASRGSRCLPRLERQRIASLRSRGLGVREIGRRRGRAPSTISRELKRNMSSHDGGVYDGDLAHARARERAHRRRARRLAADNELGAVIGAKLELEWSPEQISGWLRHEHPGRPEWQVCHETTYQAIYHGGLSRQLTKRLRTGRPLPKQGDLITGRYNRSAIGTLVDRRSRVVKVVHLPNGHRAEDLRAALAKLLQSEIPDRARRTLTWDQGSEMACHHEIAHLFSDDVSFAYPGRPRGVWL